MVLQSLRGEVHVVVVHPKLIGNEGMAMANLQADS